MNPYKPAHRLVCGHCESHGADRPCATCRRPLCERCAARASRCPRPRARRLALGRGGRLRAVCSTGTTAAVSTWLGQLRAWDLESGDVGARLPLPRWRWVSAALLAGLDSRGEPVAFDRRRQIRAAELCPCGDHAVAIGYDERIRVDERALEPLLPLPIERAAYDCVSGVLVAAGSRRVEIGVVGEARRPASLGSLRLERAAAAWVGCAGGSVAVLSRRRVPAGEQFRLRVFRCSTEVFHWLAYYDWRSGHPGELRFYPPEPRGEPPDTENVVRDQRVQASPVLAALSPAGRYLAVAHADARVGVHDLRRGVLEIFGDHHGTIEFLAFADSGRLLVSADKSGDVVVRERGDEGYSASPTR